MGSILYLKLTHRIYFAGRNRCGKGFEYIGKTVGEMLSQEDNPFEVVTLFREGKIPENYSQLTKIKENDVILIRGLAEEIARFDR